MQTERGNQKHNSKIIYGKYVSIFINKQTDKHGVSLVVHNLINENKWPTILHIQSLMLCVVFLFCYCQEKTHLMKIVTSANLRDTVLLPAKVCMNKKCN